MHRFPSSYKVISDSVCSQPTTEINDLSQNERKYYKEEKPSVTHTFNISRL